jgi:hypothetical protein
LNTQRYRDFAWRNPSGMAMLDPTRYVSDAKPAPGVVTDAL